MKDLFKPQKIKKKKPNVKYNCLHIQFAQAKNILLTQKSFDC